MISSSISVSKSFAFILVFVTQAVRIESSQNTLLKPARKRFELLDRAWKDDERLHCMDRPYGVNIDDALHCREARMVLRFGEPGQEATRAIREGFRIRKEANLSSERYRTAPLAGQDAYLSNSMERPYSRVTIARPPGVLVPNRRRNRVASKVRRPVTPSPGGGRFRDRPGVPAGV